MPAAHRLRRVCPIPSNVVSTLDKLPACAVARVAATNAQNDNDNGSDNDNDNDNGSDSDKETTMPELAISESWKDLKPIPDCFQPDPLPEVYLPDAATADERYYVQRHPTSQDQGGIAPVRRS